MTNLDKVATSHNCKFKGIWVFLYLCQNNLKKFLPKFIPFIVIVVPHIFHKICGYQISRISCKQKKSLILPILK